MHKLLATLTTALGIGAATAMFSFVHPMLLHPLLYPHADRLVVIDDHDSKGGRGSSWPEVRDIAKVRAFSDAAGWEFGFFLLTGVDEPEQIAGSFVTPNLLHLLGVGPVLGRDFRVGDDRVVILSNACWKQRFGADPMILGRSIDLDLEGTPKTERYTVIGVMPPDFWMYYSAFEVFVPLPRASMSEDRKVRNLAVFARLRDGVTLDQARSAVSAIPHDKDWTTGVNLWEKSQTQDIRPSLLVLAGGAALLLLIATANVTGLLLVRAHGRQREIAIRAALGASPWRLMRLLIGESFKLGIFAGGVGVLLAWLGLRIMIASLPTGGLFSFLPSLDRVTIDLPVLLFAIGASMCACVMAGVLPAIPARSADLVTGLKNGAVIDSPRVRTILVTAEIALSVTLLAGAGLLVKTMQRISAVDPGFRLDRLLTLRALTPVGVDRAHAETYYRDLQTRLASLPGVQSVALASSQPIGFQRTERFQIPGSAGAVETDYRVVTPGYFATLGIPIRRGRPFDPSDQHRAVISESLARKYWHGEDPIGKSITVRGASHEIIGICGDTNLRSVPAPILYSEWRDEPDAAQQVDLWSSENPLALTHAVKRVVRDMGGVVADVYRGSQLIEDTTWQQKQSAQVLSVFAVLALALAAIGLYGVISLAIGRRTREIGIRLAIGARRGEVARLVLRETVRPVLAGLALGLATALATNRMLASLLFEVAPSDALVLASVAALVTVASLFACLAPLLRALRVDPMISLRCD